MYFYFVCIFILYLIFASSVFSPFKMFNQDNEYQIYGKNNDSVCVFCVFARFRAKYNM